MRDEEAFVVLSTKEEKIKELCWDLVRGESDESKHSERIWRAVLTKVRGEWNSHANSTAVKWIALDWVTRRAFSTQLNFNGKTFLSHSRRDSGTENRRQRRALLFMLRAAVWIGANEARRSDVKTYNFVLFVTILGRNEAKAGAPVTFERSKRCSI